MPKTPKQIKALLDKMTPDQQAFAQSVAMSRVENRVYQQQLVELKSAYDELWKVMIVILHAYPDHEMRIHESQFLRFKDEYRIDRKWDAKTKEVVLRLLTLHDDIGPS